MTSKRLTPPSGPKTKQGNRQKTKLLQIFILLEEKNHQRQLFPMVVFASPPRLISGTVWPQLSPRPPVPPTTATQPQWFLRPLVVSPVSAVVSKQLVSGVEPQRPRGAQVQDPVLLQLEKLLLPEGPDYTVHQGDPQVVDGLLHVALMQLLEVAGEATVVPPPHPEVGLVLGEPLLEVLGGAHIVPGGGAGAQDVVHYVPSLSLIHISEPTRPY